MASAFSHAPLTVTDTLTFTTKSLKIIPNFHFADRNHADEWNLPSHVALADTGLLTFMAGHFMIIHISLLEPKAMWTNPAAFSHAPFRYWHVGVYDSPFKGHPEFPFCSLEPCGRMRLTFKDPAAFQFCRLKP